MRQIEWTDEMLKALKELYPIETTANTARILGMSQGSVKNKAKELGITKFAKGKWLDRANYIRDNFHHKSLSEMGRKLGISKWSVSRIAGKIGLRRTTKETAHVSSRVRGELIRRERRRIIFGLDPLTNIKVVTNRPRIRLRSRLKAKGYIVSDERNVMYYPCDIERLHSHESRGMELGLRFMPLPAMYPS